MATNWQPPFGLPFTMPMPPQTPQSQSQQHGQTPNGQYQSQNASWTPQTDDHANQWAIPGLNNQTYNQNSQSSYSPSPAAWPSSFPTPQMWQQAMQMQMQFPIMSNGAFPPPPMLYNNPPHTTTHPPPPGLPPAAPTFQPAQPPPPPATNRQQHYHMDAMDVDKEDGELSESDPASQSPAGHASAHQPPPPRSAPQAAPRSNGPIYASHRERYTPNQQAATQKSTVEPEATDSIVQQRDEAQKFIKLLHGNNIGYRALANEDLDTDLLRGLYRSLNLPSEPEPVPPPKATTGPAASTALSATTPSTPTNNTAVSNNNKLSSVKTNIAPVPPTKSAPSPVDRKDYIARLQAAKKGKQVAATKAASPQQAQTPPASATPTPAANAQQPSGEEQQTQQARQNRVIQERIQALKNNPATPVPTQPAASKTPLSNGPPATGLQSPASTAVVKPLSLPAKPQLPSQVTPTTPYSGIPGLFMNLPSTMQGPPPTLSGTKRPLPSDSMDTPAAATSANPEPKLVIEPNNHNNNAETEGARPSKLPLRTAQQNEQRVAAPNAASTPSRPASVNPVQSAVSTPDIQAPSSQARNEEMEDKQKRLAAAKLQAIQKLKQQREQNKQQKAKLAETPEKETMVQQATVPAPTVPPPANTTQPGDIAAPGASSIAHVDEGSLRSVKRLRRAKIEKDLPDLDAELAANSAKMDKLAKELQELAANDKRMQEDKAKLIEELEQLGIDTEGMEHSELRATKEAIDREQATAVPPAGSEPSAALHTSPVDSTAPAVPRSSPPKPSQPSSALIGLPPKPVSAAPIDVTPTHSSGIPGLGAPITRPSFVDAAYGSRSGTNASSRSDAASAAPKASAVTESATPMTEEEDFYSPKEADARSSKNVVPNSPSEDGEVAMSESEEEYEPDEPQVLIQQAPPQPEQEAAPKLTDDVTTATSPTSTSGDDGELASPDEAEEADDGAMDISSSEDSDSSDSDSDSDSDADATTKSPPRGVIVINDGAQPADNVVSDPEQATAVTQQPPVDPWAYVPYESPLRKFKSYRYHPKYAGEVQSGYLSLTYSHQIDPDTPVCPTEAQGEMCLDPICQNQHFCQMSISGEKLLVQLGTANPGKTPDEKTQWNEGLRNVLKNLRKENSKDPNAIAQEIAKFRREFLKDDTRVVNLQ
ncbi:unnamed protein product [Periconia digitata]|uniref:Uncharacterized protein n=1 Tax=Periconia digitata TaxID=1303443 RepID=A0A9W4UR73_9PLEO|nr:unnamed protein product [Periconia digitata]